MAEVSQKSVSTVGLNLAQQKSPTKKAPKFKVLTKLRQDYICHDLDELNDTTKKLGPSFMEARKIAVSDLPCTQHINFLTTKPLEKYLRGKAKELEISLSQYIKLLILADKQYDILKRGNSL
jgi:hypothetical protein